jgi:hypothetical protein
MSISTARRFKRDLLRRIQTTSDTRRTAIHEGMLEREKQRFITSRNVKIGSIAELRPIPAHRLDQMKREADEMDFCAAYHGKVRWRTEPKSNGGFRKVCDLRCICESRRIWQENSEWLSGALAPIFPIGKAEVARAMWRLFVMVYRTMDSMLWSPTWYVAMKA